MPLGLRQFGVRNPRLDVRRVRSRADVLVGRVLHDGLGGGNRDGRRLQRHRRGLHRTWRRSGWRRWHLQLEQLSRLLRSNGPVLHGPQRHRVWNERRELRGVRGRPDLYAPRRRGPVLELRARRRQRGRGDGDGGRSRDGRRQRWWKRRRNSRLLPAELRHGLLHEHRSVSGAHHHNALRSQRRDVHRLPFAEHLCERDVYDVCWLRRPHHRDLSRRELQCRVRPSGPVLHRLHAAGTDLSERRLRVTASGVHRTELFDRLLRSDVGLVHSTHVADGDAVWPGHRRRRVRLV